VDVPTVGVGAGSRGVETVGVGGVGSVTVGVGTVGVGTVGTGTLGTVTVGTETVGTVTVGTVMPADDAAECGSASAAAAGITIPATIAAAATSNRLTSVERARRPGGYGQRVNG
jgi:hypothetical protein